VGFKHKVQITPVPSSKPTICTATTLTIVTGNFSPIMLSQYGSILPRPASRFVIIASALGYA
jgi:hypothetical protein